MDTTEEVVKTIFGTLVATFLSNTSRVLRALKLCKECLILLNNKGLEKEKEIVKLAYTLIYLSLFKTYCLLNDHTSVIECGTKLLHFLRGCGKKTQEGQVTYKLGTVYYSLGEYGKAKTYQENALVITKEIGDKQGEAACYGNLGTVYQSLGEYGKAKTYLENALVVTKELGDKRAEATSYGNLGCVYKLLGEYEKAKTYLDNALVITKEIGDKRAEATC